MNSKNLIKLYDEVKDDLKFISSSRVRAKIIISLTSGTKELKDLKDDLSMDTSNILHAIKDLEKQDLIYKQEDIYNLSPTGIILGLKLVDIIKTISTVQKNKKLWLNHEISDIPEHMILRIGELYDSTLVESELTDIFKPLENYSQILADSKNIKGISPIFNPDFISEFKLLVKDGKEIELILTPQIIKEIMSFMDPASMMELGELLSQEKIKIWTTDHNIKVAFTVTDKFISLGLFSTNGEYDTTKDLISDHSDAVTWGNNLFEFYRRKSNLLKF
jgi:predicted transcriptional regulator